MTTKPEHTRPFNLELAKMGAPIACENGDVATILKWDARYPGIPLVGIVGPNDEATGWKEDGTCGWGYQRKLVMAPLGMIDGKPVWVGDEIVIPNGHKLKCGPADRPGEDCRWPAAKPFYPETKMSELEFREIANNAPLGISYFIPVANAALRHAINSGQVLLPFDGALTINGTDHVLYGTQESVAKVQRMLDIPPATADRDMAVAKAVLDEAIRNIHAHVNALNIAHAMNHIDLAALVARVPA